MIQAAFPRLPVRGRHFLFFAAALFLCSAQAGRAETVWQKDNDFVRIVRADGSAATSNLPKLSTDAIHAALSAVQVSHDGKTEPMFNEDQLDLISKPISTALAEASPGQDVAFAVHGRNGFLDYIGPPRTTAGRLFVDGDALSLIVGMVNGTYLSSVLTLDTDNIRIGSRMAAQETEHRIVAGNGVSLAIAGRTDWARISPAAWVGTQGTPVTPSYAAAPAPSYAAAPAQAPVAAQAPASPAMLAAPVPQDPNQIEQRFAALKRLLDSHMISQDEYDHAKADLLKAMASLPPR